MLGLSQTRRFRQEIHKGIRVLQMILKVNMPRSEDTPWKHDPTQQCGSGTSLSAEQSSRGFHG